MDRRPDRAAPQRRRLRLGELGVGPLIALLLVGGARAQEPGGTALDTPRRPARTGLSAAAGLDAWSGGGGAAAELGASLDGRPTPGFGGWARGRLEVVAEPGGPLLFDALGAGIAAGSPAVEASLTGSGSVASGWAEGLASADLAGALGPTRWALSAGLGARGPGPVAPLGRVAGVLERSRGLVRAELDARLTGYAAGPPLAADGGVWLEVGDRLRGAVGVTGIAVPASAADPVPGLPAPGAAVGRVVVAGGARLGSSGDLRLELAPEAGFGADPYQRLRAMVVLRLEPGRPQRAPVVGDGVVRFALRAPEADEVELLAAFSDWDPVPMHAVGHGWWEVSVPVPAGRWEYTFRVDGVARAPPDAPSRVDDGLGGVNGVIDVP